MMKNLKESIRLWWYGTRRETLSERRRRLAGLK